MSQNAIYRNLIEDVMKKVGRIEIRSTDGMTNIGMFVEVISLVNSDRSM